MKISDMTKTLEQICRKIENSLCADCNNKKPTWASIDFGVLVCLNCSGAHRALGPSITRVRSTSLDQWQQAWIAFLSLGNLEINQYLEHNLNKNKKPCSNSSQQYINGFVHDKYVKRKYINSNISDPMIKIRGTDIQKIEAKNPQRQNTKQKSKGILNEKSDDKFQKIFKTNHKDFIKAATNFQSYNPKQKESSKRQICSLKVLTNTIKPKPAKKKSKEMDFDFDFQKAKINKGCDKQAFAVSFNDFAFPKGQLKTDFSDNFDFSIMKSIKKTKQSENCEELPLDQNKQKQITFEDVFSRTVPPLKIKRNVDPFGIL